MQWCCCCYLVWYDHLCYVMLCYLMFCRMEWSGVLLMCVMLCGVLLRYVMLCYVMLCYVMWSAVILCYVTVPEVISAPSGISIWQLLVTPPPKMSSASLLLLSLLLFFNFLLRYSVAFVMLCYSMLVYVIILKNIPKSTKNKIYVISCYVI